MSVGAAFFWGGGGGGGGEGEFDKAFFNWDEKVSRDVAFWWNKFTDWRSLSDRGC